MCKEFKVDEYKGKTIYWILLCTYFESSLKKKSFFYLKKRERTVDLISHQDIYLLFKTSKVIRCKKFYIFI